MQIREYRIGFFMLVVISQKSRGQGESFFLENEVLFQSWLFVKEGFGNKGECYIYKDE